MEEKVKKSFHSNVTYDLQIYKEFMKGTRNMQWFHLWPVYVSGLIFDFSIQKS